MGEILSSKSDAAKLVHKGHYDIASTRASGKVNSTIKKQRSTENQIVMLWGMEKNEPNQRRQDQRRVRGLSRAGVYFAGAASPD